MPEEESNEPVDKTVITADKTVISSTGKPQGESAAGLSLSNQSTGTLLPDRFELISELGKGGMGVVYKARNRFTNAVVEIKMIEGTSGDQSDAKRLLREAQAASSINHAGAAAIIDFGTHNEKPYLVMEYIAGITLDKYLYQESRIDDSRTIAVAMDLCRVLTAAHNAGVIHRDIKPSNIMLPNEENERLSAKLLDFGLAKIVDLSSSQQLTQTGEVLGTPLYMSPEQCMGTTVDERSDIYSLGAVMYRCLTGKPPHMGESVYATIYKKLHETPPSFTAFELKSRLEDVVMKCMELKAEDRYQKASELLADLEKVERGEALTIKKTKQSLLEKLKRNTHTIIQAGFSKLNKSTEDSSTSRNMNATSASKWKGKTLKQWNEAIDGSSTKDAELFYNRAVLHLLSLDYNKTYQDLDSAIQIDPKYAEAYAERALFVGDNRFSHKALADANTAISLKPNSARCYLARARFYESTEQHLLAIADAQKAISLGGESREFQPDYINVYEILAASYTKMGRFADAQNTISSGLSEVESKYRWLLYQQRAVVNFMKQEFAAALEDLWLATKEVNCRPIVWSLMAYCYLGLGQHSKAEEAITHRFREFENNATAYYQRAEFWRLYGDMSKAIDDCTTALEREGNSSYSRFRLRALCYIEQGNLSAARMDLMSSFTLTQTSAQTLGLLAMVEDQLQNSNKAQHDIEQAFALSCQPPIVYVNRASLKINAGRLPEALADVNMAISLDPYLKEAFSVRKEINEKLGHKNEANADGEFAARLLPHLDYFR